MTFRETSLRRLVLPTILACCLTLIGKAAEQVIPPVPAGTQVAASPPEVGTSPAPDTAEETIALARSFLGGEEALDNITSIRFRGSILMEDGTSGDVDIIVQKPMQQHVTISMGSTKEVTALDGYEAWRRVQRLGQQGGWELTLLSADQVRHLRANAFENIAFFKGIESVRGGVEFLGEAEKDGVPCVKLAFTHPGGVSFVRYFNSATGQLVVTETGLGGTIRESGEIRVRGVRFPKELVNATPNSSSTVIFSSITLNEEYLDSLFEVPMAIPSP